jgi:uncharacterized membrane protein YdcZ (DUF606 family)
MPDTDTLFADLEKLVVEEPAEKAAPKRAARSSSGSTSPKQAPFEKRLFQFFTMVALVMSATLDPYCGGIVQQRAQALAKSWNDLATQDKNVRQALEWLLDGGAYGSAVLTTAMTVLPILRHHGMLPGALADVLGSYGQTAPSANGHAPGDGAVSSDSQDGMDILTDAGS